MVNRSVKSITLSPSQKVKKLNFIKELGKNIQYFLLSNFVLGCYCIISYYNTYYYDPIVKILNDKKSLSDGNESFLFHH